MKADLEQYASYLSEYLGYKLEELKVRSSKRELVLPRQKIMAYLHTRKVPGVLTNSKIGAIFGLDHSSVNHAVIAVANDCYSNKAFKKKYNLFRKYGNKYELVILPEPELIREFKEVIPQIYEFMDKHSL